jgi:hypothetical protein
MMRSPYMATNSSRLVSVPVDSAFLLRCYQRWRALPSLREAAKAISLIDEDEAKKRRMANGDAVDLSGLRLSYQTIVNLDVQAREIIASGQTPPTVSMGIITYLLLCAWMGEPPQLPLDDPRIKAIADLWRITYNAELQRQGKLP